MEAARRLEGRKGHTRQAERLAKLQASLSALPLPHLGWPHGASPRPALIFAHQLCRIPLPFEDTVHIEPESSLAVTHWFRVTSSQFQPLRIPPTNAGGVFMAATLGRRAGRPHGSMCPLLVAEGLKRRLLRRATSQGRVTARRPSTVPSTTLFSAQPRGDPR